MGISCTFLWLQDTCNSHRRERPFFPSFSIFKILWESDAIYPLAIPNSALWNVPTRFSNHHHYLIPKYLYHSESKPYPYWHSLPSSFSTAGQAATSALSEKQSLLDMSCEWNHRKCDLSVWLLSSDLMSPGILHVSCVSTSFLVIPE